MTARDELVEAMARAIYVRRHDLPWDPPVTIGHQLTRLDATAALDALLSEPVLGMMREAAIKAIVRSQWEPWTSYGKPDPDWMVAAKAAGETFREEPWVFDVDGTIDCDAILRAALCAPGVVDRGEG